MLKTLILTLILIALSFGVKAQCNHALKLERAVPGQTAESGLIEISVKTAETFVCTIFSESGSGLQQISKRSGQGNQNITFTGLSSAKLYLVQVEFTNESNKFCRKLQKSQITL